MWLRRYGEQDWSPVGMQMKTKKSETPAQEIKRLKRALEDAELKNLLINEVIDIMDREHGANLRKKYLARERELFNNRKK